jgi:hypothetical protein
LAAVGGIIGCKVNNEMVQEGTEQEEASNKDKGEVATMTALNSTVRQ